MDYTHLSEKNGFTLKTTTVIVDNTNFTKRVKIVRVNILR